MHTKTARTIGIASAAIALLLPLAACSSTSSSTDSSSSAASSSASPSLVTTSLTAADVKVSDIGANMTVEFPTPSSASKLTTKDITVGTGAEAKLGAQVSMYYYLAGAITGTKIESSFGSAPGAPFDLQPGMLIDGWVQGVPGMKVGGQRTIVIPGALAYGATPPGPEFQPNETLVFVVQLLAIS